MTTTATPTKKTETTSKTTSTQAPKKPTKIKSVQTWQEQVLKHWTTRKKQAEAAKITSPYAQLIYIAIAPILPKNKTQLKTTLKLIGSLRYCEPLKKVFKTVYEHQGFTITPKKLIEEHLAPTVLDKEQQIGLDWLIVRVGALSGLKEKTEQSKTFLTKLQTDLKEHETASAVRVQAGMISAGQNVVFAGQDVNIVSQNYKGDKAALRAYLSQVRTDWNIPATNIHPRASMHSKFALHQLFIPPDTWTDTEEFASVGWQQLNQRRFQAIDLDFNDSRQPAIEAISAHPLVVITGGAGTGKSSLCHFIMTALAYACDPKSQKDDGVNGLSLLGPAWLHGALLPLYVSLRDFVNDKEAFPKTQKSATANSLIKYLKKHTGDFAPHLEAYLTQTDVETHGTLLVLDGLDEVYDEKHRIILRRIIENWADRFKQARVILTSRTYAYRHDARWRLTKRFVSMELAPFTWRQVRQYVERWYAYAAECRPSAFGGRSVAETQAQIMATDLVRSMIKNKALWPLARQPLMLALLTLIHEDYKYLPSKRAELYEQTVELLDRWNIPSPVDTLHEKLATINLERMRAALKHIAYELQSEQKSFQRYPTTIQRGKLLEKLAQQQETGDGLGANIEDVLEYLATRNGILVTDAPGIYRFPHLSIQEYLAACALIEFYDECQMPSQLKPNGESGWVFPENIVALLRHDVYRWRQVALFAGSIIAAGKGQDPRWQLIDELLPVKIEETVQEQDLHSMSIAAEIWSESYLKARTPAQHSIKEHLTKCLKAIKDDERLDAPERAKNNSVLATLEEDNDK